MMTGVLPGDTPLQRDERQQSQERRRFSRAVFASGLAHAALLGLLIALWQPREDEPPPPIPITLTQDKVGASGASGGGTGETAASSEANASDAAPAFSTAQAVEAPAQRAPEPLPPQPVTPPTQTVQSAVAPELPPTPKATQEPVPARKPAPPQPPHPIVEAKPLPPVTPAPPSQPAAPLPTLAQAQPTPSAAQTESPKSGDAQTQAGSGGQGRGEEGAGRAAVGNGARSGTSDDYLAKVRLWILRFKNAPDDDCTKKQGKGSFGITIARDGTLLKVWLEQSSGCPRTDEAALQMARNASPVPPLPTYISGASKDVQMPFDFTIGLFGRLFH